MNRRQNESVALVTFDQLVLSIVTTDTNLTNYASKAVNQSLTLRNWLIGYYIAHYELNGSDRAEYGENLLAKLSDQLQQNGVSNTRKRQLYYYLFFYRTYPEIVRSLSAQFIQNDTMIGPRTSGTAQYLCQLVQS